MRINTKINELYSTLTGSERSIADFLLLHPRKSALMSAQNLGEASGSSAAAVIRLMKKLGYSNLYEMRSELSTFENSKEKQDRDLIIRSDDSISDIVGKLHHLISDGVTQTEGLMNLQNFKQMGKYLREANTIYLFGIGASGIVADDLYQKLIRINKRVVFNSNPHLQLNTSINTTKSDVAIIFTYSGDTTEMVAVAESVKRNETLLIGVTRSNRGYISKICDFICPIPDMESEIRLGAIASRYCQFFISDLMFMYIAQTDLDYTASRIKETRGLLTETIKKLK
jgi:DNA-binding MurR/RpiR family transcriptional regulator